MSDDKMEFDGKVIEALPGAEFLVKLDNMDKIIKCRLSGKLRQNKIRIIVGDLVIVKISIYNLYLGIISYRHKKNKSNE